MSESAAITGLGAVSPLGWGVRALWEGLLAGRSGLGAVTRFDVSAFRSALGGEVPPPPEEEETRADASALAERYLLAAVREALRDSRAPLEGTALVVGTNFGGMSAAERALAGGGADLSRYEFRDQAERVARELGLTGVTVALSLSCASGTATIVEALGLIRAGRAERVVAAGYDELSLYAFAGLSALRAISPDGIRPFDLRRGGTVFSEGAGAIVVESERAAKGPGRSRVLARLLGGALNNDAYHMTAPEKEARGTGALMKAALADAGVSPAEIDHVNLHGTGTKYNDLIETKAMKAVFGGRARSIPVTANKGALGHAMGAAGSLETIAAILTMRDGKIPPTLGLEERDPECDLDVVTGSPREVNVRTVLKTSYGIGGTNAGIVLRSAPDVKLDDAARAAPDLPAAEGGRDVANGPAAGVDRYEAGGHEEELARVIDEVEREREGELREARGRKARGEVIASIRVEILRRFARARPDVKVRFLTGPYADPDAPRGQRGRKR